MTTVVAAALRASPRALRRALGAAIGLTLAAALVAAAALPTGGARLADVLPIGARILRQAAVGDARAVLVARPAGLQVVVAYPAAKGWFGARVPPPPAGAVGAWAATPGAGEVPALSMVYGRTAGTRVLVRWADGLRSSVEVGPEGAFLVVRAGKVRSASVTIVGPDGATVEEITGP